LVAFQTPVGGDIQAALRTGGLTNSAWTTVHLLLTSGDEPSLWGDGTFFNDNALMTMTKYTEVLIIYAYSEKICYE